MTANPADGPTEQITVDLGQRSYDILIGPGLVDSAGAEIAARLTTPRAFIITDTNVAPLLSDRLAASLTAAGIDHQTIVLPAGEATKSFGPFEKLVSELLRRGVERATTLVALGGGVIGDITGFAASTLLRGINYVQVPTTLLAQVDSSVGGKTAINAGNGKNLVGSFYQPRLVLADTQTLDTLPKRELLAGYAEVVKYGLLGDAEFFAWLEANGAAVLSGDDSARIHAVAKSCRMKAAIVAEDEHERGQRALLNLGHTFAHALEAETGFGDKLLHGEAVAIGMVLAFELSARLNLCPPNDVARVRQHLAAVGLSTDPPPHPKGQWDIARLISLIGADKKVAQGKPVFVLARTIGDAFIARDIDLTDVEAILGRAVAA
ncbi:MAG: 3-dehydroquinate synthase [Alphaproteobacteria bacterium]|nr:3-dehydroquinate synthase [Alphaproteobacteria bacterium]